MRAPRQPLDHPTPTASPSNPRALHIYKRVKYRPHQWHRVVGVSPPSPRELPGPRPPNHPFPDRAGLVLHSGRWNHGRLLFLCVFERVCKRARTSMLRYVRASAPIISPFLGATVPGIQTQNRYVLIWLSAYHSLGTHPHPTVGSRLYVCHICTCNPRLSTPTNHSALHQFLTLFEFIAVPGYSIT